MYIFLFEPKSLNIGTTHYFRAILCLSLSCPIFFTFHPNDNTCISLNTVHLPIRIPFSWLLLPRKPLIPICAIEIFFKDPLRYHQFLKSFLDFCLCSLNDIITVLLVFVCFFHPLFKRPQTTYRQFTAIYPVVKHSVSLNVTENLKNYFNLGDT